MPESNAAAKRRQQKMNRALGVGDEQGRLVRVKDPPKLIHCTKCQHELKITKTNTELIAHATSKHASTLEECFPGAAAVAIELLSAATATGKGAANKGGSSSATNGETTTSRNKKDVANLDNLLDAGLSAAKKKGKK